ncbi:hydrophobin [Boletus edulis]|nr:hydrophobin [Boletus edulis]
MLHTALFLISSLTALAAAQVSSQCAPGDSEIVCCNMVQSAYVVPNLLSTTGISNAAAADLGLVGLTCTTLTVIGLGKSCATKQMPLCCTDNNYNGTISLGCSYINPMLP